MEKKNCFYCGGPIIIASLLAMGLNNYCACHKCIGNIIGEKYVRRSIPRTFNQINNNLSSFISANASTSSFSQDQLSDKYFI